MHPFSCIHICANQKKKNPNIIIAFVRTKAAGNITKQSTGAAADLCNPSYKCFKIVHVKILFIHKTQFP